MSILEQVVRHALELISTITRIAWVCAVWLAATMEVVARWAYSNILPHISLAWETARGRDMLVAAAAGFLGATVIAPLLVRMFLRIIGFGPRGPVAGSRAARYQSRTGSGVDSKSLFSTAQRVSMGGPIPFLFKAMVGVSCGLASLVWVVSSHS